MKNIYLVLSQTGTILSKTIKVITNKEYNHISLSLDGSLDKMYSFGRKSPNNPFIGVFVVEGINKGTFLKFQDTKCKVIEISVSDKQYEELCSNIYYMLVNREKYKYNLLGLCLAAFHICLKFDNKFYCSEFVRYIMNLSDIDVSMIPEIAHPTDFVNMENNVVYEGLLRDYSVSMLRGDKNVLQKGR